VKESVQGTKDLIKKLKQLEPRIANKVLKVELRAAIKEISTAIKANTPVGETKQLKRAIKTRAAKSRKWRIAFNSQIGAGNFKGSTFYGAMVELGTEYQEAQHFMQETFDAKSNEMKADLPRRIAEGIEREAAK
jgi:HK97 gp10 family phage protein